MFGYWVIMWIKYRCRAYASIICWPSTGNSLSAFAGGADKYGCLEQSPYFPAGWLYTLGMFGSNIVIAS